MGLRHIHLLCVSLLLALAPACGGDDDGGTGDGDGDGGGEGVPDGEGDSSDDIGDSDDSATPACDNGIDDDNDGTIDGDDPECTGPLDDREGTFATGIPGDNIDATWQDCFFDGNSGAGNDGCRFHSCCLYLEGECPEDLADNFEPAEDCEVVEECTDYCAPLTPVGCDCFGCCTVCDPMTDECDDIITNPAIAPDCDFDSIGDEDACPRCEKAEECGGDPDNECDDDPEDCVLCPGQTEEDLPDSCNEMNECPGGQTVCDTTADCGASEYCANGCCTATVD